jgi:TRAP-type C4-dicarboxylate transport system permease small subunit
VVALCVFLLIAWQGIEMVMLSIRMNDQVSIVDIPLYPFQVIVPLGAFLVCPVLLIQLIQLVTGRTKEGN